MEMSNGMPLIREGSEDTPVSSEKWTEKWKNDNFEHTLDSEIYRSVYARKQQQNCLCI